jgi:hypothetical protein
MTDIECPGCKIEFEAREWDDGECPSCSKTYYWDEEFYDDDYSDSWTHVMWE